MCVFLIRTWKCGFLPDTEWKKAKIEESKINLIEFSMIKIWDRKKRIKLISKEHLGTASMVKLYKWLSLSTGIYKEERHSKIKIYWITK